MTSLQHLRDRFSGEAGRRRLVEALRRHSITNGNEAIAEQLAAAAVIEAHRIGTELIKQDAVDTDLLFLIVGKASVLVNNRQVSERRAGDHVGEMALIDVQARRSATVIATDECIVARICEEDFSRIANAYPHMWRFLAIEIARRLRQRGQTVPHRNERPRMFIGSSVEGLPIARALQAALQYDPVTVTVWTDGVFQAPRSTIHALEHAAKAADFAVLVLSPDDTVVSRGNQATAPRDNVVFELGLFVGALGHERTYIVRPRGVELKVPTDLLGVTPLDYQPTPPQDLPSNLAPACTTLRQAVLQLHSK